MDMVAMVSSLRSEGGLAWMVLYIGPDVFMPFLAAIAGAVGLLLVFWQRVTGLVARLWRAMFQRQG